jgi:DNA polymerase-1
MANPTLRSCIVAEEGYTLLSLDAKQIELIVVAILSQDPLMLQALGSDDLHMATAIQVFGWTDDADEMKQRRYDAKQLNFAILYGADEYKVAEMAECSLEEAREMIRRYFSTYTVLKQWIDNIKRQAKIDGFVTNLFGRVRYIPELSSGSFRIREKGEREAVNSIVQGTAVDIVKKMMLYLREIFVPEIRLVLQVHDEILWEVPDEFLSKALELCQELKPAFPDYPCTVMVGKVYGDLKEV